MCKLCGDCTKSSPEHIAEVQREIAEAAAEMRVGYGDVDGIKRHIATFEEGDQKVVLGFGYGNFDEWCIYVVSEDKKWMLFPTDEWYFDIVKSWTDTWPAKDIYADFVKIYDATSDDVSPTTVSNVVEMIKGLSWNYRDEFEAQVIFTILYMGMIAEENKAGAILKKRIKRLGIYQILMEDMPAKEAAHYSRGKTTFELAPHCLERGF